MNRRPAERGAVALVVAVVCVVLVLVASLCVDLGLQRVVRTDMQSVADVAALDMARQLAAGVEPGSRAWNQALTASLADNATTLGEAVDRPEPWTCTARLCARATAGVVDGNGVFSASVPDGAAPDAVQIVTTAEVDFALRPGTGSATRSAVASLRRPSVCFSVGTKALTLDASGSALSPLLADILRVNLDAVGYDGLADLRDVEVPLGGVLGHLDVGSVDQVTTAGVSLAQLLVATAAALGDGGDVAEAGVLDRVQVGASTARIELGKILALSSGDGGSGLDSEVNVLDLVGAGIIAANGDHGVDAGALVPGVVGATLTITEPPVIACGGTGVAASSAQIRLHVVTSLPSANGVLGGGVDLAVQVGSGDATLSGLGCLPASGTFDVDTGAARVLGPPPPAYGQVQLQVPVAAFLGAVPGLELPLRTAVQLLGLPSIGVDVLVVAEMASASRTGVRVDYPASGLPAPTVVAGNAHMLRLDGVGVRLSSGQEGLVSLLGALLDPTFDALLGGVVTRAVDAVVDPTVTAILDPTLAALGITLGDTEVDLLGPPRCQGVRLVG